MKTLIIALLFVSYTICGQVTMDMAYDSAVLKYHIGSYSYHEQFKGHKGYGAPLILTSDNGAAAFGDGDEGSMLVKLNKNRKVEWRRAKSGLAKAI